MAQDTKHTQAPLLCLTGCGFYGNARTNGMCSICYRDSLPSQSARGTESVSPPVMSSTTLEESTSALQNSPQALGTSGAVQDPDAAASIQSSSTGKRKLNEILLPDAESGSETSPPPTTESDTPKPRRNRCFTCHRKLGLTGFDCRCGNVFCGLHRYSDVHRCTFDYRRGAAERIRRENPVITAEKISKI